MTDDPAARVALDDLRADPDIAAAEDAYNAAPGVVLRRLAAAVAAVRPRIEAERNRGLTLAISERDEAQAALAAAKRLAGEQIARAADALARAEVAERRVERANEEARRERRARDASWREAHVRERLAQYRRRTHAAEGRERQMGLALERAAAEGRNVLPDATDDQAAVIEAWALAALADTEAHDD